MNKIFGFPWFYSLERTLKMGDKIQAKRSGRKSSRSQIEINYDSLETL